MLYDVVSDRVRKKIYETCLDYGLAPVQYSTFFGCLDSARRLELCRRIDRLIVSDPGNYIVVPLTRDLLKRIVARGNALGISQTSMVQFI